MRFQLHDQILLFSSGFLYEFESDSSYDLFEMAHITWYVDHKFLSYYCRTDQQKFEEVMDLTEPRGPYILHMNYESCIQSMELLEKIDEGNAYWHDELIEDIDKELEQECSFQLDFNTYPSNLEGTKALDKYLKTDDTIDDRHKLFLLIRHQYEYTQNLECDFEYNHEFSLYTSYLYDSTGPEPFKHIYDPLRIYYYMKERAAHENMKFELDKKFFLNHFTIGVRRFFNVYLNDDGQIIRDTENPEFFKYYKTILPNFFLE